MRDARTTVMRLQRSHRWLGAFEDGLPLPPAALTASIAKRARLPPVRFPESPPRIFVAFAIVIGCFLASTYYFATRLTEVDRRAAEASATTLPTILKVALLRTRLHDLESSLEDARSGALGSRSAAERAGSAIDAHYADLVALPAPTAVRALVGEAAERVELARTVARSELRRVAQGIDLDAESELHKRVAEADHALAELIETSVVAAERESERTAAARARITAISLALEGASLVVSVTAALAAIRAVRKSSSFAAERAHELEMFAARLAHDVRGPLAPALLALQRGVKEHAKGEPIRDLFELGVRSLHNVRAILDDLFTFARSGARPDRTTRADVGRALGGLVAEVGALACDHRVQIATLVSTDRKVRCAPGVLVSMLSNLVRNAIKYMGDSPRRRIDIRAFDQAARVRVEVADTGPGLAPGTEASVFEPYVRGPHARGTVQGIGLGLATVKRFAEAHGGAAGVESHPGEGCTFWFELPAEALP